MADPTTLLCIPRDSEAMDLPVGSTAFPSFQNASIDFECANNQIFLVLTGDQVLLLLKAVRAFPQEQIFSSIDQHRQNSRIILHKFLRLGDRADCIVASCAASEQLSLLTTCLTQSLATSSAVDSMLQARACTRHDSMTMPGIFEQDMCDDGPPLSFATTTFAGKHFCIACDTSFANSEALKKHQTEFCERKLDWVCPTCPDQTFGLLDRLNRHHCKTHAETCRHGCDKRKTYPSDYCKTILSQCYRITAEKKAWGCPCCISCFDGFEAWDQHKAIHRIQNEKVEDWSFSTMVRSLLHQETLGAVFARFLWSRCNWSGLGKRDCQSLKLALERHVLPSVVKEHPDYSRLGFSEALALYTFRLGTTGKACTELVGTPGSKGANRSHLTPSSYETPEQIFPSCQTMNMTSQPHAWLEGGSSSLGSQHTQNVLSSPIPRDLGHEDLMTWNTYLEHYSPALDSSNNAPTSSYRPISKSQQDPALFSTLMHNNSGSFPGHQQLPSQPSRPGFRHRVRRALGEGLQAKHFH